jgi:hypothetical protein
VKTAPTWTDQPIEVADGLIVCRFFANSQTFEVRKAKGGVWYLTVGNLFGSQTLKCYAPEVVFDAIDAGTSVSVKEGRSVGLPAGAELISAE